MRASEPLANAGPLLTRPPKVKRSLLRPSSWTQSFAWPSAPGLKVAVCCQPDGRRLSRGSPRGPAQGSLRGPQPEPASGDRQCGRGHREQAQQLVAEFPRQRARGLWSRSAGAWAPANRQRQRLLGRFYFKQKTTLSGNMCPFFSPWPALPPFLSPFRFQIFLFFGASLSLFVFLCLALFLSLSLSLYLLTSLPLISSSPAFGGQEWHAWVWPRPLALPPPCR